MSKGKRPPADPVFAAEMAALADEHRQIFIGDFHQQWKERLEREMKVGSLYPSKLHRHKADCWDEPHNVLVNGTWITARRCRRTGALVEVRP